MKFFKSFPVLLLLAVSVAAQNNGYNYPKPEPPRGTYLPPPNQPPPTTRPPPTNQQQAQIDAEGLNADGEHEPGMPFDFTYAVKDDVGNDFSHQANSDGDVVKGEYRTLLPDGRLQIVKYTADWKNGYNAEVTYEGEAQYPEPPPKTPAPFRPDSQTDIDSQGVTPPRQPATQPPRTQPPPTYRPVQTQPPPTYRPVQTQPPRTQPPPTYRPQQTQPPPVAPPGLYGAPSVPFGVRNNPKFGYNSK